eukprot:15460908-Alexandrium_andersonii.AAC.1
MLGTAACGLRRIAALAGLELSGLNPQRILRIADCELNSRSPTRGILIPGDGCDAAMQLCLQIRTCMRMRAG